MLAYVINRLGQSVIVLWMAYTLVFLAIHLLPSDQIDIIYNADEDLAPGMADRIRAYYGLDQPLHVQYFRQLLNLVQGDFGLSISTGQSVATRISSMVWHTVWLATTSLVMACLIAGAIAYGASLTTSRVLRGILRGLPELFSAVPSFWMGLVVLHVFSIQLRLISLFPDGSAASLLVPAFVLAISVSAPIAQALNKSIDQLSALPYVTTARAKGLSPRRVLLAHIAKNALGPGLTIIGLSIGSLFAGSVVTETVFARPGLGTILLQALAVQDIVLVQGLVLMTAVVVVATNLIVDLVYPLLDPRIVAARKGRADRPTLGV